MIYAVLSVILIAVLIVNTVISLFEFKNDNSIEKFAHNFNLVNKWILIYDNSMLVRVNGDFWLGYCSKQKNHYSLNCGKGSLGKYETEERCQEILKELSIFLADDNLSVYTMPKE